MTPILKGVRRLKRVGFYDLDLNNFHANVYLSAFRNDLKDRGFEVTGCTGIRQKSSLSGAEENGVPYFPVSLLTFRRVSND